MPDATIELVGGEELRRALEDPEFVRGPATEFVMASAHEIQSRAMQNAPVNTGRLRQSITVDGPRISAGGVSARVGTNLQYANPVEFGSRPHWPPLAPLVLWVRRKIRPQGGRRGESAERAVRRVAFLVQRKIAREGTPARPFMAPGVQESRSFVDGELRRLGDEITRRFGRR